MTLLFIISSNAGDRRAVRLATELVSFCAPRNIPHTHRGVLLLVICARSTSFFEWVPPWIHCLLQQQWFWTVCELFGEVVSFSNLLSEVSSSFRSIVDCCHVSSEQKVRLPSRRCLQYVFVDCLNHAVHVMLKYFCMFVCSFASLLVLSYLI